MPVLINAPETQLFVRQDNGRYRVANPQEVTTAAALHLYDTIPTRDPFSSPDAVRRFLTHRMQRLEHEVFAMLVLNNRNQLIDYVELFRGTIDGCSVHPREVVTEVLRRNGAAVVLAHNHPSGESEPSQADEVITRRLKSALALLDIRLLDHVIVGNQFVSLAERGLI